jgi:hypothetical protein
MPDLVTVAEFKVYLGERATLREPGWYTAAATARTEVLDGTGSSRLYLAYPIAALTSIKLGYDSTAPTETLDATNKSVVVYGVGSRLITRTDGGVFGTVRQARYVEVVYDHAGNLPEDAKLPIMEVAASAYRNRGSEGMKSETVGSFYSYTRDDAVAAAANNVNWQLSVAANTPVVLG